jgi:hypothetical protein
MEKTTPPDIAHEEITLDGLSQDHKLDGSMAVDQSLEHELTVKHMFANHKTLIFWTLWWATCAIGWGFDAQVNGAMISVPSFRRDFG